jgi:DNA repair protein RAD50
LFKFQVSNLNGVEKTVIRSMKSEITKGGKLKYETLDSTICTSDPKRGREDISGRVEDINANMCEFMGVSKAIINNVVFCHQEDSNWPLDEGKKLKEKFDAIFGTTEYNKAINRIINIRKNYSTRLTETQGEKRYCSEIKEQVEKKEYALADYKNNAAKIERRLEAAVENLLPLEKRKEEIMEKERNLGELAAKRERLKQT